MMVKNFKKQFMQDKKSSPFVVPTNIYFKLFAFQYLAYDSIVAIYSSKFFLFLNFYFSFFLFD
jgi:hypothetical protein